ASWTPMSLAGLVSVHAIWGTASGDLYVGGDDGGAPAHMVLYHYDGASWRLLLSGPTGIVLSVASANGRVFVGGRSTLVSYVAAYDGTTWTDLAVPPSYP